MTEYYEYANKILYSIYDAQRAVNIFGIETGENDFNSVSNYLDLALAELQRVVKEKEGNHDQSRL